MSNESMFVDLSGKAPFYGAALPVREPNAAFTGNKEFDVVVIGGGLAGLTTAVELSVQNKRVLLLEAGRIGDSPSGRNGGQVVPMPWVMHELAGKFGSELSVQLAHDVEAARHRLHQRIDSETDQCDSQTGIIKAGLNKQHLAEAQEEAHMMRTVFDFHAIRVLDRKEIQAYINSQHYIGGLMYEDARHIHPEKYLRHLIRMAQEAGTVIAENSPVQKFSRNKSGGFHLQTPAGQATAANVVIACGARFHRPEGLDFDVLGRRFVPTQTVIVATEPMPDDIIQRAVPGTASWFDMRYSHNYARCTKDNRILFGGCDTMTDIMTSLSARSLIRTLYQTLPTLAEDGVKVEACWSGSMDVSRGLLPSIRCLEPGLYEASGFSGRGMVLTALAAEAIAEDIATGGQSERLERLSGMAPDNFSRHPVLAKMQLIKAWIRPLLHEKFFS